MRTQRHPAVFCLLLASLAAACSGDATGPGASPYDRASALKGGISYDSYWNAGTGFDQTDPLITTFKAKSDFFRCKQCHGWDQLGTKGYYANRAATTSRPNISSVDLVALSQASTPQQLFDAIKSGSGASRRAATVDLSTYNPAVDPSVGDRMPNYGAFMSDEQIWDLVRFLKEGALDVSDLFDMTVSGPYPTATVTITNLGKGGSAALGETIYAAKCSFCHGLTGKSLALEGLSLGVFVRSKSSEVQHKVRYGQPGSIMRGTPLTLLEMQNLYKYLSDSTVMPR